MVTVTMDRDTTSRGLGMALADQAGLAPITAGPLAGPQVVHTGEALVLRVPAPPQVSASQLLSSVPSVIYKWHKILKRLRSCVSFIMFYRLWWDQTPLKFLKMKKIVEEKINIDLRKHGVVPCII